MELDKDNQKNFRTFEFDLLMTNPPFAGEVTEKQILKNYLLSERGRGKMASKMSRDILFIERNLNFLKDGGRLAIVLPQGRFNKVTVTAKMIELPFMQRNHLNGKSGQLGIFRPGLITKGREHILVQVIIGCFTSCKRLGLTVPAATFHELRCTFGIQKYDP